MVYLPEHEATQSRAMCKGKCNAGGARSHTSLFEAMNFLILVDSVREVQFAARAIHST